MHKDICGTQYDVHQIQVLVQVYTRTSSTVRTCVSSRNSVSRDLRCSSMSWNSSCLSSVGALAFDESSGVPEPEDCSARDGCREEEMVAVLESAASALAASAPTRPKPVRSSARGSDGGGDGEDACRARVDMRLNNRGREKIT